MSGRNGKPNQSLNAEDRRLSERLRNLDRRLDESRAEREAEARVDARSPRQGAGLALRLGSDFVAGVVVGAALGWGFDKVFGTSPWGLIVLVLLGFVAGVLSVMRTAGLIKPGPAGRDDIGDRLK